MWVTLVQPRIFSGIFWMSTGTLYFSDIVLTSLLYRQKRRRRRLLLLFYKVNVPNKHPTKHNIIGLISPNWSYIEYFIWQCKYFKSVSLAWAFTLDKDKDYCCDLIKLNWILHFLTVPYNFFFSRKIISLLE